MLFKSMNLDFMSTDITSVWYQHLYLGLFKSVKMSNHNQVWFLCYNQKKESFLSFARTDWCFMFLAAAELGLSHDIMSHGRFLSLSRSVWADFLLLRVSLLPEQSQHFHLFTCRLSSSSSSSSLRLLSSEILPLHPPPLPYPPSRAPPALSLHIFALSRGTPATVDPAQAPYRPLHWCSAAVSKSRPWFWSSSFF